MRRSSYFYPILIICLLAVVTSAYYNAFSLSTDQANPDWYGAWVKTPSITSKENIDQMLDSAESGGFNVIFVNVVYEGYAFYNSKLLPKSPKIEEGFDPLAYLVPEAHRRGIEVHAWFMVGKFGDEKEAVFLEQHPDWAMQAPDGEATFWLNFNLPDVRIFVQEMMMETIDQYGVNGLHFDYTRYPGNQWGYDPHSVLDFKQKSGIDAALLRFDDLPAYGFLEGNPLDSPTTAQVLARFSNGLPAISINKLGDGQVLLLNWDATERNIAASSEVLSRSIDQFVGQDGDVGIFHSETNGAVYGFSSFEKVTRWIEYLGWQPKTIPENELATLSRQSVLILPNIYRISTTSAKQLEDFVKQGGHIIFIDGPTKSIHLQSIQAITGMASRSKYFNQAIMIYPNGKHDLIPSQTKKIDMETYQSWIVEWTEYRQDGINLMIKDIYRLVKNKQPQTEISVTITSDIREAGSRYMQDYRDWLRYGYIDLLIPRAYVEDQKEMAEILKDWEVTIKSYPTKVKMGLISYANSDKPLEMKPPEQLIREIDALEKAGMHGFLIFHLENMSFLQLNALKNRFSSSQIDE